MNDYQKRRFSEKVIASLYNTVSGKKIAVLGWAFKKDTNDTRESATIYVSDYLLNERALLSVYDPKVTAKQMYQDLEYLGTRSHAENSELLKVETDPYEAVKGAHAVLIMTEWDAFKTYDWEKIYSLMEKPAFVFDGRNLLINNSLEKKGFRFFALGR